MAYLGALPEWLHARMLRWAIRRVHSTEPDVYIGGRDNCYMERRILIRSKLISVYIHRVLKDDDPVPHDHPAASISVLLREGYVEYAENNSFTVWMPGDVIARRASTPHRLARIDDKTITPVSLFIMGPRCRDWGFHCPTGWVYWETYLKRTLGINGSRCD